MKSQKEEYRKNAVEFGKFLQDKKTSAQKYLTGLKRGTEKPRICPIFKAEKCVFRTIVILWKYYIL